MDLREHDYPTILLLMKSYMDMQVLIIPHMMEELPYWRAFVIDYITDGKNKFIGHTKA